jgi:hypothetical protein
MLRIGGAGAPRRAVRPMVGPPTPSLNQSGEEPANGERNTRRARPEVRVTGRAVAPRFGPLDPLAGDARPRRRSGRTCRRRTDDGYACASRAVGQQDGHRESSLVSLRRALLAAGRCDLGLRAAPERPVCASLSTPQLVDFGVPTQRTSDGSLAPSRKCLPLAQQPRRPRRRSGQRPNPQGSHRGCESPHLQPRR